MADIRESKYAHFLEDVCSDIVKTKPKNIAVVFFSDDGGAHTHYFGTCYPAEVGQMAWQLFQSTHPVGGGTALARCEVLEGRKFQSTHPVGGGTSTNFATPSLTSYFNPPTPWGVGLFNHEPISRQCVISIHPPRGGWDEMICSARSGGNEEKQNNYQKSIKNLLTFTPQCANIYSQGRKPENMEVNVT